MPDLFGNPGAVDAYGDPLAPEQLRDAALVSVADNAGPLFIELAKAFVPAYLAEHGATSAEDLTDACKADGIVPHNDKAFGCVYSQLSRSGSIRSCGTVKRRKGHASGSCNVWELTLYQ